MDKPQEIAFNNQIFNTGTFNSDNQTINPSIVFGGVVYGQGKHQEILEAIQSENLELLTQVLQSTPSPDRHINAIEPTFKQTMFYKVVNLPNEKTAVEISQILMSFGGRIDIKDIHGQSPMFYISKDGKMELLQLFLRKGADINETDNFRQTPLFYAARDGRAAMIRFMIQNRANPNHRDKIEETPLFYAASNNRLDACRVLVEMGADVNIADNKKQTALYFAKLHKHPEVENLLVELGAIKTKDGILRQADLKKAQAGCLISATVEVRCYSFGKQCSQRSQID